MRHIMAIYDVDPLYATRFADVVNQTEKIPFDVLAFSSFDKLKKFAKENPVGAAADQQRGQPGGGGGTGGGKVDVPGGRRDFTG